MTLPNIRYPLLLGIFALSLIISIIISLTPTPLICNPAEGCDTVLSSTYAKTFGVNNSTIGVGIFALMSFITFSHMRKPHKSKNLIIRTGILFGALISLYFIYLQAFVLHAWCKYCMVVDVGLLVAFVIINIPEKKMRANPEMIVNPKED